MKNIIQFNSSATCYRCNLNGFFCYTPSGAAYNTCPVCCDDECNNDDWYWSEEYKILEDANYCRKCRILYTIGCTHACNGCTDDCYNGHIVGKWKIISTNTIYIGMPCFDSELECQSNLNNIEILEWICPNNGLHCDKGSYPKTVFPQYYNKCSLSSE